ncbi:MAG: GTP-binding protein HSR1 [Chloroflexota bacterium]|nr:MAG: GTP-binding protein HSR1 [Chloroflexota bacterium]HDD61554.1 GTP-binding protein [Chloroflexota bacterium]
MPTNLPADYFNAEERFRSATTTEDKIKYLEEMMGTIPKHKGTDHLRADLRKKLSKLKTAATSKKSSKKQLSAYHINKEGAGQIIIIGTTNVGKSSLVANQTNADPEVSEVPFTTWTAMPGMMKIDNIQVQVIDTPPIGDEYIDPEFLNLIRRVDLVLVMIDLHAHPVQQLEFVLQKLQENRIAPKYLEGQIEAEGFLLHVPTLVVVNKFDSEEYEEHYQIFKELLGQEYPMVPVSVQTGHNLEALKQMIFEKLGVIRVYSKAPGKDVDKSAPFVVDQGIQLGDFAGKVHKDFQEKLKSAKIWGTSADFDGQMVSRDHVLEDEDIVELQI